MLDIGDTAPDFELTGEDGKVITLDDLLSEGPLILYFYPADFTSVCTAEACEIRDRHEDLRAVSANVVGVSPQGESSHNRFRNRYDLPFPLLDDRRREVIKAYGVSGPLGIGVRRVTFLINPDKKIANRVVADFGVKQHMALIDSVVEDLGGY
ncbi:MAG: peroxiredoxin [Proteobacteria bacterium]|nr:peroxiredoxin [Pseudomonadota bacterium]